MRCATLLDFFPEERFPELSNRIREILYNQSTIFDNDPEFESWAQNIAARVLVSQQAEHAGNSKITGMWILTVWKLAGQEVLGVNMSYWMLYSD